MNLCSDTKWNHLIFSEILNYLKKNKKINIEIEQEYHTKDNFYYNYKENYKNKLKKRIINIYNKLAQIIIKNNKVVIYKTSIGLLNDLKVELYNSIYFQFI